MSSSAPLLPLCVSPVLIPTWGTADTEIKVPPGGSPELSKVPLSKPGAAGQSISFACYTCWRDFLPNPSPFIQLYFFPGTSPIKAVTCRIQWIGIWLGGSNVFLVSPRHDGPLWLTGRKASSIYPSLSIDQSSFLSYYLSIYLSYYISIYLPIACVK